MLIHFSQSSLTLSTYFDLPKLELWAGNTDEGIDKFEFGLWFEQDVSTGTETEGLPLVGV